MKNIGEMYIIIWQDAAFSFEKELPKTLPKPNRTVGFFVKETDDYINITNNMKMASTLLIEQSVSKEKPLDGFLIPKKCILSIHKIPYEYNN